MPVQLVRALMQLVGETVDIELKNGTKIQGSITGVDPQMNTHLKKVKITVRGKNPVEMDQLSVRGGTIRYYILPEAVNIDHLLQSVTATKKQRKEGAPAEGRGRGRGRGVGGRGFGGRGRGSN